MKLGEKLAKLRERAGLTQEQLSEKLNCDIKRIIKLENSGVTADTEFLKSVKKALGCEQALVAIDEIYEFLCLLKRTQLFDGVKYRLFDDDMRAYAERVFRVKEIPFEPEVTILYKLHIIKYFIACDLPEKAAELLLTIDLTDAGDEIVYRYEFTCGLALMYAEKYPEAIEHFSKLEERFPETASKDVSLHTDLFISYARCDMFIYALTHLEAIRKINKDYFESNRTCKGIVGGAFLDLGFTSVAKNLLEEAIVPPDEGCDVTHGSILGNLGEVYLRDGDFDKAIEYHDKAFTYFPDYERAFINNNMLLKTYALFQANRADEAENLLNKGISLTDESTSVGLLFRALSHSKNLNNNDSLTYLENIIIPKLISKGKKLKTIEYCDILENFYKEQGCDEKVIKYLKLKEELYKKILYSGENIK
ncbi:MAG: helix-turn-helix domain-containing protein [Oscillospiraceae bacterium]|jgi:tetratricopeptide (TPR) repeat protein|nr:helix-turn-helix domain-containing protein [Oscillospiraceae bacterium]